jgi:hypothetical protein
VKNQQSIMLIAGFFFALGSLIDGLEGDICHTKVMANGSIHSGVIP